MHSSPHSIDRREALARLAAAAALPLLAPRPEAAREKRPAAFRWRHVLASSLYGRTDLAVILAEARRAGVRDIDLWPEPHADQREQARAMGRERFAALLRENGRRLAVVTCYRQGPFGLREEMEFARALGAKLLVTGSRGSSATDPGAVKAAVLRFARDLRPHVEAAAKRGLAIGIENHAGAVVHSPDSIRWLADAVDSPAAGIALAPYHLALDGEGVARLVRSLGERLVHFYAWQHGKGCDRPLPASDLLLQMPGRGPLDFEPIAAALRAIRYGGLTEIFMHPVPRGVPIRPSARQVTEEFQRARRYLEGLGGWGKEERAEGG